MGLDAVEPFVELAEANGKGVVVLVRNSNPGSDAFQKLAKRPILINVSRGALIDEAALIEALDAGRISAAGLDVLADEPPALDGHPLAGRENVILTPHVAFFSDQSMFDNRRISALNIRYYFESRFGSNINVYF